MRVMVMVKASPGSEAGKMPSEELMSAMGSFNEELVKAGIMDSGDGLKPSNEGYRIRFSGSERSVTKGPFAETNELVAGYWIWTVDSMEQAIEWVKKCPNPMEDEISDIEIRSFYEAEDFVEWDESGEFAEKDNKLRNEIALQKAEVNNYLFFSGRCEEALEFYKQRLGITVEVMFKFSDNPNPMPEGTLQAGFENKIMHAEFKLGATTFYASDGCSDQSTFEGFSVSIRLQNKDDVTRIFEALAEEGEVTMPLEATFFSPLYGQVKDKFGLTWMVMIPGPVNTN